MSDEKEVVLERAAQGSFGFSILGGAGMKYPACVCEVDDGGPANLSNMVHVGDRLLKVNGEEVGVLPPKDLVLRIRQAPSPSSFVLQEDLELRKQVMHVLRKKERKNEGRVRKERISSTGSEGSVTSADTTAGKVRRKSSPSYVNAGTGAAVEETGRRKKQLDRIIEVEPSVNISGNQSGIVKVHRNKILGRLDAPGDAPSSPSSRHSPGRREWSPSTRQSPSSGEGSSRGSPQRDSPLRSGRSTDRAGSNSPYRNQKNFALPDHAGSTPNIPYSTSNTVASTSAGAATNPGIRSLDRTPEHAWAEPGISDGVMNGDVRILSDSSSGVSPSETPARNSIVSTDDKSSKSEMGSMTEVVIVEDVEPESDLTTPEGEEEEGEGRNYDSGVALQIPSWDGHPLSRFGKPPRASLSEEILMGEMAKAGMGVGGVLSGVQDNGEATNAMSTDVLRGQELANSSPQRDRTHQVAKLVRRSSSKKKSGDPYTSSVTMARRLYMLDGFKKSEVAAKLSDPSDYGKSVAVEYLKFFEFQDMSLVESLRQFLLHFSLTGESQERERVMVHFSNRYHECNPTEYESVDTVHGVTIALLLLNTDLHTNHGGKKMTSVQFSHSVDQVAKGISKSLIRSLYDEIKKKPLKWAVDDDEDGATPTPNKQSLPPDMELSSESSDTENVYHVTIPGTFVEVELSASTPLFKEGYVLKKNIMEAPHKKVSRGKRQWRPYYAYLKGFLLYLQPPRQGDLHLEDTSSALCICHTIAMGAYDYHKKNSVLRVTTAEWQSFLLQANDTTDMQQWILAINKAAATYSSPPLAAAVSSSTVFQRPTFPLTPTRNTVEQQAQAHEARVKTLNKEKEEHQAYKPAGTKAKHDDLKNWFDKYEFLGFEIHRFQVYYASLFNSTVDSQTKLPSGLVPSPSISTLATSGTTDGSSELSAWKSVTPPGSPKHSERKHSSKTSSSSPLTSSKKSHKKK